MSLEFSAVLCPSDCWPFDCWLLLRGLKTMHLRTYKAQDNAVAVARFLQTPAKVPRVLYAGLPDHPGVGGYNGPCPPRAATENATRTFAYRLTLYALAQAPPLGLPRRLLARPAQRRGRRGGRCGSGRPRARGTRDHAR